MFTLNSFFKKYSESALLAAISIFLLSKPYFVWGLFQNNYIWGTIIIFCFILFALNCKFDKENSKLMFVFWGIVLITLIWTSGTNFMGAIPYLSLLFIPFARISFMSNVKNAFVDIVAFLLILSLTSYILALFNIIPSMGTIDPLNEGKGYKYLTYPFLVVPIGLNLDYFRFHAFWDEPGCVGTYTALLLGVNGFKFKGWQNIVFLISGILSLSFFFFIVLLIALVYKTTKSNVNFKKRILIFGVLTAICSIMLTKDTFLYKAVGWRFEYNESTGSFAGDNRVKDAAKDYLESIAFKTEEFYWGVKSESVWDVMKGGSSYLHGLFRYGFVAFALYVSFFIVMAMRNIHSKTALIVFLLILFGCIYQRPGIADIVYVFLYTSWIRLSSIQEKETKQIKCKSCIINH